MCIKEVKSVHARSSYCKFEQWSHAGEQLQDEGFAVEDVELPAAELDALPQERVALIVGIDLTSQTRFISCFLSHKVQTVKPYVSLTCNIVGRIHW